MHLSYSIELDIGHFVWKTWFIKGQPGEYNPYNFALTSARIFMQETMYAFFYRLVFTVYGKCKQEIKPYKHHKTASKG